MGPHVNNMARCVLFDSRMKKKQTRKNAKLNLKKETLRDLQSKEMANVAGGNFTFTCPAGASGGTNYCNCTVTYNVK